MEYNSNGQKSGLNKRVTSLLHHIALLAMLHSSFIAPAQGIIDAYIHNKKPLKYSGVEHAATTAVAAEENFYESMQARPAYEKAIRQAQTSDTRKIRTSYAIPSDLKEGIIGVSKEKPLDSPSDNLFKVSLDQLPQANDKVYLTYEVFGVADHHSVARSINERLSIGGHLVKKQQGWSAQKEELNPLWLHKGQNTILFTIPEGADYQYKIKNLSIRIEKNHRPNAVLTIDNRSMEFSKEGKIYIKGFIRGDYPKAQVAANGISLQVINNEFEGLVTLTDESKKLGFVMVKATQDGGLLGQEMILVNDVIEADRIFVLEKKEQAASKFFKAGVSSRLDIEGASIMVGDSAITRDYELSVSRLRNIDIAPMESGMINVTKGGSGYRFLPDGTKFEKPVSLSIAYDTRLIPTGYTEKDVKTYYFDTDKKRWISVHTDSIDVKNNSVVSKTTHFTDYINGIIQAPDSPETSAFTPTMMSDVKAADPSAEMTLISPPSASQKGDANISYPIKVPSGRRGMQPQLGLQYSNAGSNGWLGLGWSLNTPALTIETKWGVPLFDTVGETEFYALNGEQLMYPDGYLPHRHQDGTAGTITTVWQNRNASGTKVFYPRQQGSFAKIERLGNTPQTYYWKVTNTDGTIYWYGGKTPADVQSGIAVLKDTNDRVVHWALYMVEDVYGNTMKYHYQTATDFATGSNLYLGKQLYLTKINYTGYGNDPGNYDVEFVNTTSYRPDISINARLGFKQVDFYLLDQIKVSYKNELIRSYKLNYGTGKFNKSLLTSVAENDKNGTEFYRHAFEYYDDVKQADGSDSYFSAEVEETLCIEYPEETIDTDGDGIMDSEDKCKTVPGIAKYQGCPDKFYETYFDSTKFPPEDPGCLSLTNFDFLIQGNIPSFDSSSAPLGSSKTKGYGVGFYFGLGLGCKPWTKNTTFGKQWTDSYDKSESFSAMIDINGDGLDDLVYKISNGNMYFQKHIVVKTYENGSLKIKHLFRPAEPISGINNFYKANSTAKTGNFQVTFGFSRLGGFAGKDKSEVQTENNVYFTDANGDKLPDIVKNGTVFFNRLINDNPVFLADSKGSPNMVITAEPRTIEVPAEYNQSELDIPNYDVVKVWEAPYKGNIKITNNITLTDPTKEVTITIESRIKDLPSDITCLIYGYTLNAAHPTNQQIVTTTVNPNCMDDGNAINVIPGQLVFFRVHSSETSGNPPVNWDPKIEYLYGGYSEVPSNPSQKLDQNGLRPYVYQFSENYLLSQKEGQVVFPGSGTATVTWDAINVNAPSDDVLFEVYKAVITIPANGNAENSTTSSQLIYKRFCPAGQNKLVSPTTNDIAGNLNNISIVSNDSPGSANTTTVFYFKITSDSNVKWKQIEWKPRVNCVTTESVTGEDNTQEGTLTTDQTLYGIPDITTYKVFTKEANDYTYTAANAYREQNTAVWPISSSGQALYILPHLTGLYTSADNGTMMFVVKRNGLLIGKRKIIVTNGSITFDNNTPINIGPQQTDKLEIGFYADDSKLPVNQASLLSKLYTLIAPYGAPVNAVRVAAGNWTTGNAIVLTNAAVNLFQIPSQKFGPMYSQWGQFAYNPSTVQNATSSEFGSLIKISTLTVQPNAGQLQTAINQLENWGENITEANLNSFETQYGGMSTNIPFFSMYPMRTNKNGVLEEKWMGVCPQNYVSALSYRAAGMEEIRDDFIDPDDYVIQEVIQTGAYGINKYTKGKSKNLSLGANLDLAPGQGAITTPFFNVGASVAKSLDATSNALTDYTDLNGDGYPDIVSTDNVQYTKGTGGLRPSVASNSSINGVGGSQIAKYGNSSWGFSASGSYSNGGKDASNIGVSNKARFNSFKGNSGAGISGNYQRGNSQASRLWADVNGDGLADILEKGPDNINVRLNLGNNQYQQMQVNGASWGLSEMFNTGSYSYGGGIGVNKWNGSVELGISLTNSSNSVENALIDINADGLADVVHSDSNGISVRVNKGAGFIPAALWANYNMANESGTSMSSKNLGLTYAPSIPFFFGLCLKFAFNGNGQDYSSTTRTRKSIADFDGDGFPDLIKEHHKKLRIQYSNIRRTNMLKTVENPLGGKFTVDYDVLTPTYDNPFAKWVLKSVVVEDGYDLTNDGEDTYNKRFEYENGYYDRREREFYGYEKIKTIDDNYTLGQANGIYRTSVSEFHNRSYYLKGMLRSSYMMRGNNSNQIYATSVNNYKLKALNMATGLMDLSAASLPLTFDTGGSEGRKAAAVVLESTENYIYEFASTALVSKVQYTYDDVRGRITKYDYKGNIAVAEDNYTTDITYYQDPALEQKNIYTVPGSIVVKDHTGAMRRKRVVGQIDANTGAVTKIGVHFGPNSTDVAETTMLYDAYGNLIQVTMPPNESGQQFGYKYTYDTDNNKLPVSIKDGFGYISTTTYDLKLDKVLKNTDITGNQMNYTYDTFGRTLTVQSPKELQASVPYTISFGYYPKYSDLTAAYDCVQESDFMPVAVTSHYDDQHPSNDIQTYTFIDGMARPVQVKKDIEINTGNNENPNLVEAVSVSGKTYYDQYGRVNYQFQSYYEDKECGLNLKVNEYEAPYASATGYDAVDRPDYIVDFEGNVTSINYAIGGDYYNSPSLKTTTNIQQNNSQNVVSQTMKDVNGRVTAKVDILTGANAADLWYRFNYNSIGELTSYIDSQNLTTTYKYDMLGRKTALIHPDNGTTTYYYDKASNLTKLQTANLAADTSLQADDRFIKYSYEYNRLLNITFPVMPSGAPNISNVDYKYGSSGNETGKLIYQRDATGPQTFAYGSMGEMIANTRRVVAPNIPTREFITTFTYDSWCRIKDITYPDGEVVNHQYNKGGNLVKVTGEVGGSPYDYVQRIDYDYFEQKTYQLYGNGTDIEYAYTPGLRRLNTMIARTAGQQSFLDNTYNYDKIGNITSLVNAAAPNASNMIGGTFDHTYTYDNLNRLISAAGSFTGDSSQASNNNDYQSEYSLAMTYNTTHGILTKDQSHSKNGQSVAQNNYASTYAYYEGTHKVETIFYGGTNQHYKYDLNGNMTYTSDSDKNNLKNMYWDESNRLRVIDDSKFMHHYIYDAGGERVLKASANPESLYNNGMAVSGSVTFSSYTTYPSGYIVVNPDGKYSKHYYTGSQRIVSRVAEYDASIFEATEGLKNTGANSGSETSFDEEELRQQQIGDLTTILQKADLGAPVFQEYQQADEEEEGEEGEEEQVENGRVAMRGPQMELYFYHPDHLGTSTFLTDANGELYQFFLNLPFGETMAEQHSLTADFETPYKFNGKELDSETGLYYYGARYYDPRTSIWLSTDPLMEDYPNVNPYAYCLQNPVMYTDPTGMSVEGDNESIIINNNTGEATYVNDGIDKVFVTNQTGYNSVESYKQSVESGSTEDASKSLAIIQQGGYELGMDSDIALTARIVFAEMGGIYGTSDVDRQVVAESVINRVKSGKFGKTYSDVLNKKQYNAVGKPAYNNPFDFIDNMREGKSTKQFFKAKSSSIIGNLENSFTEAFKAYKGLGTQISKGATFYVSPPLKSTHFDSNKQLSNITSSIPGLVGISGVWKLKK